MSKYWGNVHNSRNMRHGGCYGTVEGMVGKAPEGGRTRDCQEISPQHPQQQPNQPQQQQQQPEQPQQQHQKQQKQQQQQGGQQLKEQPQQQQRPVATPARRRIPVKSRPPSDATSRETTLALLDVLPMGAFSLPSSATPEEVAALASRVDNGDSLEKQLDDLWDFIFPQPCKSKQCETQLYQVIEVSP